MDGRYINMNVVACVGGWRSMSNVCVCVSHGNRDKQGGRGAEGWDNFNEKSAKFTRQSAWSFDKRHFVVSARRFKMKWPTVVDLMLPAYNEIHHAGPSTMGLEASLQFVWQVIVFFLFVRQVDAICFFFFARLFFCCSFCCSRCTFSRQTHTRSQWIMWRRKKECHHWDKDDRLYSWFKNIISDTSQAANLHRKTVLIITHQGPQAAAVSPQFIFSIDDSACVWKYDH